MNHKIITLIFTILASIGSIISSESVKIGDLYYNLDATTQTAEVTQQGYLPNYPDLIVANIPENIEHDSTIYRVTKIGQNAFHDCHNLVDVTIPNSVKAICMGAFFNCSSLEEITIPDRVTYIGVQAFSLCSSLKEITIPDSVTSIAMGMFYLCSQLTKVTLPDNITRIYDKAFMGCPKLSSIKIPQSVTYIDKYDAFSGCNSLTSVELHSQAIVGQTYSYDYNLKRLFGSQVSEYIIGEGVTEIGEWAFSDCSNIKNITIPDGVTKIAKRAFQGCSGLTNIIIPGSVSSIGDNAFTNCSGLTSIIIPDGVTSIGYQAFSNCNAMTSVTIPNSVTEIGEWAFIKCSSLTSIANYATTPQVIVNNVWSGVDKSKCTLYVPDESINLYKSANVWKDFYRVKNLLSQDIESVSIDLQSAGNKFFRNGQLLINKNGKTYTIQGQEVK